MKKPYLLIAGYQYECDRGTLSWKGCFETFDDAKEKVVEVMVPHPVENKGWMLRKYIINDSKYDWYEIVDLREWAE